VAPRCQRSLESGMTTANVYCRDSDENPVIRDRHSSAASGVCHSGRGAVVWFGDSRFNSAKGIAYLYLNMKKFEDAKTYYRVASDLDPTIRKRIAPWVLLTGPSPISRAWKPGRSSNWRPTDTWMRASRKRKRCATS
jgi:hypothetical protein